MGSLETDGITAPASGARWYCARAHVKREALAAAQVRQRVGIEVFCPRLRLRRATRRGPVWFIEALFPGYFFCRFPLEDVLRRVLHAPGVTGLVRFGGVPAEVPAGAVAMLRTHFKEEEPVSIEKPLQPGDEALVASGPLAGLKVLVTRVMPASRRLRILVDLLGRSHEVDIEEDALLAVSPRLPAIG